MGYLAIIAAVFVIIPTLIGMRNFSKHDGALKYLSLFLLVSTFTEIASGVFIFLHKNNYPVLHVFTLLEFIFLSLMFSRCIGNLIPPKVIFWICLLFCSFSVVNSLFIQSIYTFNTHARGVEFLFLILYSLVYLYQLTTQEDVQVYQQPMFWVSIAMLLYCASSFFVILLVNHILSGMKPLWLVHNIFLLLHYILFSYALWIKPNR